MVGVKYYKSKMGTVIYPFLSYFDHETLDGVWGFVLHDAKMLFQFFRVEIGVNV